MLDHSLGVSANTQCHTQRGILSSKRVASILTGEGRGQICSLVVGLRPSNIQGNNRMGTNL